MSRSKLAIIYGTRPEVIKLAPLIEILQVNNLNLNYELTVISSGQHRELISDAIEAFNFKTDIALNLMKINQSSASFLIEGMSKFLETFQRDNYSMVVVHGDTGTACAAALAAHHLQIPVAHVEAGLRSGNLFSPWPEESNRRIIDGISSLHFAPTTRALENLVKEGYEKTSSVTGNTVVDSTLLTLSRIKTGEVVVSQKIQNIISSTKRKIILVTQHRRENFGDALLEILNGIKTIAAEDVTILFPVHPNPNVRRVVVTELGSYENIIILEPLSYQDMIYVLSRTTIVITDSGGLQEEGPTLGVPVLVTRETSERPEGIAAGSVKLIGTKSKDIVEKVHELLSNPISYAEMSSAMNPYGDGSASVRIRKVLLAYATKN
jgi:UDP-N-acetylglucosamine 2-epimerase (non-hydrolysing)